jgi:hypothetical protein
MMRAAASGAAFVLTAATAFTADAPPPTGWQKYLAFTLSDRARGEFVDWFEPKPDVASKGAERYSFFANQLRFGVRATVPHVQLVLEGQDVRLPNLPDDASLPPPTGNLGPGALYFAHSPGLERDRTYQGETFLRQAYVTLSDPPAVPGLGLTGGRFEYSDGLETVPSDASLAWLKRSRIAERLVGPFNYTHIGRSFDGLRLVWDQPSLNLTAVAFRPTHGGFEISANRELGDIGVAGLAATAKRLPRLALPFDARLFYLYYDDRRFSDAREEPVLPIKVDNRPLPERAGEADTIAIHTGGLHVATVAEAGPGKVDGLVWAAVQAGEWGRQDHTGWAFAIEGGYQLPTLWGAPWLRVGYDQSSGDDDPEDGDHRTFFQVLPTARIYAQFPFFNSMNSQDTFTQLILKPHPRVSVRTDYHWLRLTEKRDLWYAGGGATNDDLFGFSGIPADNHRELAHLVDLGVTVQLMKRLSAYAYYGHAFGQGVVKGTFAGAGADYGYVELTFRY